MTRKRYYETLDTRNGGGSYAERSLKVTRWNTGDARNQEAMWDGHLG